MSLEAYRTQIDKIDDIIIDNLEKRQLISGMIAKIKKKQGISIENTERENNILSRLKKKKNKINEEDINDLYNVIFKMSKKEQKNKSSKSNLKD